MDATELNRTLKESARSYGLCDEWYNEWKEDCTLSELAEKMYKGLDFCLKLHWPSNNFIKEHFDLDFRRMVNVFVDDKYSILNQKECLVLGNSEITARYNGTNNGYIHVRDNSSLRVVAKNSSFALIHLYEKSYISVEQYDNAKVVLIKHSQDVTIIAEKNVKIREEYDYLET